MKVFEFIGLLQQKALIDPEFMNKEIKCNSEDGDVPADINGVAEAKTWVYITTNS